MAAVIAMAGAARAHAGGVPVWSNGEAGVFDQEAGDTFDISDHVALPISSGSPTLLKNTITFPYNFGVSNASAGLQHTESTTAAKIIIASGTGVSQSDDSESEFAPSTLEVSFTAEWTVPANGFGTPISSSFSLPIGAKIGAYGSAGVSVNIAEDYILGSNEYPLSSYQKSQTWENSTGNTETILTSFTPPTTLVTPSSLTSGEIFVINGDITFSATADDPTLIEIPTAADFGDAGVTTDEVGEFQGVVVPEPTSASLITLGVAAISLRRRRRPGHSA